MKLTKTSYKSWNEEIKRLDGWVEIHPKDNMCGGVCYEETVNTIFPYRYFICDKCLKRPDGYLNNLPNFCPYCGDKKGVL